MSRLMSQLVGPSGRSLSKVVASIIVTPILVSTELAAQTQIRRVSVSATGVESNRACMDATISADGNHVAFVSGANTLVELPPEGPGPGSQGTLFPQHQVYLVDISGGPDAIGPPQVVSLNDQGYIANGSCANPRIVTVNEIGTGVEQIYVFFETQASNLDPDDDDPAGWDVYVRNVTQGTTKLVTRRLDALGNVALTGALQDSRDFVVTAQGTHMAFVTLNDLVTQDINDGAVDDVYWVDLGDPRLPGAYPSIASPILTC